MRARQFICPVNGPGCPVCASSELEVFIRDVTFPAVYEARCPTPMHGGPNLHSITGVPTLGWDILPYIRNGRLTAKSRLAPEVSCFNGIDVLVRELARLEARNLTRDRVFVEARTVMLTVRPYGYEHMARRGHALGLLKVKVELL